MSSDENIDKLSVLRVEITRMRESIVRHKENIKKLTGQIAELTRQIESLKSENTSLKDQLQQQQQEEDDESLAVEHEENLRMMDEMQSERWWIHLSHRIEELYVRLERQNEKINKLIQAQKGRKKGDPGIKQEKKKPERTAPRTVVETPAEEKNCLGLTPAKIELTSWQKANIARSIEEHERRHRLAKKETSPKAVPQKPPKTPAPPPAEEKTEEVDLPVYITGDRDKHTLSHWFTEHFGKK